MTLKDEEEGENSMPGEVEEAVERWRRGEEEGEDAEAVKVGFWGRE